MNMNTTCRMGPMWEELIINPLYLKPTGLSLGKTPEVSPLACEGTFARSDTKCKQIHLQRSIHLSVNTFKHVSLAFLKAQKLTFPTAMC